MNEIQAPKYLALAFEDGGTAFKILSELALAWTWLKDRGDVHGMVCIFELHADLVYLDYDSYGEAYVGTVSGEAELIFEQDLTTLNTDERNLGEIRGGTNDRPTL